MDTEIQRLVDSFIGAYVLVISQDDKNYKGFIRNINIEDSTIRLDKVICYGTRENPITAYGEALFRGSHIKDLQVLKPAPPVPNEPPPMPYHASFLGHFLSVLTKEEVRVEGIITHFNRDEERLVMENAYCWGTEGRRRRIRSEIPPCRNLVDPVVFKFREFKEMELIFIPNNQRVDYQALYPALARQHVQH